MTPPRHPRLRPSPETLTPLLIHEFETSQRDAARRAKELHAEQRIERKRTDSVLNALNLATGELQDEETEATARLADRVDRIRGRFIRRRLKASTTDYDLGGTMSAIPLHSALLLSTDSEFIDMNRGKRGNPWILPTNPEKVDCKDVVSGGSWCLVATASAPATEVGFWFGPWSPDATAAWNLLAVMSLHGFYIVRSSDTILTCRHARVRLSARVRVWQYVESSSAWVTLFSRGGANINEYGVYDRTEFLDMTALLKAGDPVWVLVTLKLDAATEGGGTHAELNFADGVANYVEPLLLAAGH